MLRNCRDRGSDNTKRGLLLYRTAKVPPKDAVIADIFLLAAYVRQLF